jgi:hypothetical protein
MSMDGLRYNQLRKNVGIYDLNDLLVNNMKRIFRENLIKDGFTPGKTYRVLSISYTHSLECYQVIDDHGIHVSVAARIFRDFSIQERREKKLKQLGL